MSTVEWEHPDTGERYRFEFRGVQERDGQVIRAIVQVIREGATVDDVAIHSGEEFFPAPRDLELDHLTDEQARELVRRASGSN